MKNVVKLEELAQVILGVYSFSLYHLEWWWFLVLFFIPDISMLGYALGNRTGALLYNLFHHKALAILIFLFGLYIDTAQLQLAGIILFSHSAFDRMLGYGLKYEKGFGFTHLGRIGKTPEGFNDEGVRN